VVAAMTDQPACALCARPVVDMAYVCDRCAAKTVAELERVALVAGEAMTTIAKQARMGSGGRRTDTEVALPYNPAAAADHDAAVNTLTTWARHVHEQSGRALPITRTSVCAHTSCARARRRATDGPLCEVAEPEHPTAVVALWLVRQLGWIRHRQEAEQALDEIGDACRVLVRVVDRPADHWYAGRCDCGEDLYPVAEAKTVRCRGCASVHDLDERKVWLLDQAEDVLAGAAWCAATLERLGVKVTASTIRTWAERSQLASHGFDAAGRPLYRLGTVRGLALESIQEDRVRRLRAAVRKAEADEKRRARQACLTTDHEAETLAMQTDKVCP
jgi:hypothetical protein